MLIYLNFDHASLLEHILSDRYPMTYVDSHNPNQLAGWWWATLPINETGQTLRLEIRGLHYDFRIETTALKEEMRRGAITGPTWASCLGQGEIVLYQSTRSISDNFVPRGIEHLSLDRKRAIWKQVGIQMRLCVPHVGEVAQIWTEDHDFAEQIIEHPSLKDLIIEWRDDDETMMK